ncbi:hypothetical protein DRW41_02230 [Neobacillus piezotolerans]|uniref:DUF3993 domain-containing protein n=1 Tax=Neobacillus piezotolerans TaxID=2259171 RepID=A0A3D8GVA0_9BACI|nr:DUF3993 domain-containing protein [Neobacillus piezotolerans]RDU38403.1 hypothetical protein DRW41_02230 [Neobacillus piezotolerans]
MKKSLLLICAFILFLPIMPLYTEAETSGEMRRDEAFSILRKAFEAQLSLGEQLRTREEVDAILAPYFTDAYKELFLETNLVEEEGKYITYGTDFGQYYIPYYGFSDNTKFVAGKNKAYVFEFFPESNDGPVGYKSHYEGLLLVRSDEGWKVSKYLYDDIPDSVIAQSETQAAMNERGEEESSGAVEQDNDVQAAAIRFQLGMNPIGGLFQYAAFIGKGQDENGAADENNGENEALVVQ